MNKAEQTGFNFAQDSITTTYAENATTSNVASGGESAGAITYSIDDTSVATVDNNGQLTIKGAGTAKISATKDGDSAYNPITINYVLTVNKANQTGFNFAQASISTTYAEDAKINNEATGGEGTGAITYSIDNTSVATVNNNGQLTIKGAGTANITASKASDANYNAISNSYILTVDKADQTGFNFAQASITTGYEADAKK